jgi:hypothetical protein
MRCLLSSLIFCTCFSNSGILQIPGSMSPYGNVFHALQEIGKNEGLKGLYRYSWFGSAHFHLSMRIVLKIVYTLKMVEHFKFLSHHRRVITSMWTDNSAVAFELKNVRVLKIWSFLGWTIVSRSVTYLANLLEVWEGNTHLRSLWPVWPFKLFAE